MYDYLYDKYGLADYIVLKFDEEDLAEMVSDVNALIGIGYQSVGGISIRTGASRGAYLLQAMIKT